MHLKQVPIYPFNCLKNNQLKLMELTTIFSSVFFSFFYVFKQTFIGSAYSNLINLFLIVLIFILFFILIRATITFKKYFLANSYFIFLLLFLASSSFFQDPKDVLIIFIKFNFVFIFLILTLKNIKRFNLLLIFTDVYLFALVFFISLSYFNLIESTSSETELWVKNFSGFLNPNVPSFFIFSICCCYFVFNKRIRFVLSFLVWLVMIFIGTFSRTSIVGVLLLVISFFIFHKKLNLLLRCLLFVCSAFALLLNFLFICLSIKGSEVVSFISKTNINTLLSNRLAKIAFDTFERGFFWYDIKVTPFDGVHYELFFSLGVLTYFYFFYKFFRFFLFSYKKTPYSRYTIAICILVIVGSFEGVLGKITPGSMMLFALLLTSFQTIDRLFEPRPMYEK